VNLGALQLMIIPSAGMEVPWETVRRFLPANWASAPQFFLWLTDV